VRLVGNRPKFFTTMHGEPIIKKINICYEFRSAHVNFVIACFIVLNTTPFDERFEAVTNILLKIGGFGGVTKCLLITSSP
jgi:hypothetical protein